MYNLPVKIPRLITKFSICMFLVIFLLSCNGRRNRGSVSVQVTTVTVGVALTDLVQRGEFNAYAVSVVPGSLYKISMTAASDDADLLFFAEDSSFSVLSQCAVDNTEMTETSPEDCIVSASNDTFYFGVDGTFLASSTAIYTVKVEQLAIVNLNPSIPILDITTQTGARVYAVTGTSASVYTVAITGLDNDADLSVFGNNANFTAPAVCSLDNTLLTGTTPEDCTLATAGGTLYFIVDGLFSTTSTVLFTAFASLAPAIPSPANQGSAGAPIGFSIDSPTIGQVGFGGTSYHAVNGLTAGVRYTVGINGITNNANLTVYNNDSSFTTPAACLIDETFYTGTIPEACTFIAAGNSVYFTIMSDTISGGVAFIALVEPGP